MLEYYKQEMRDLRDPESGRMREVYKVLLNRSVTAERFMDYMAAHSSLTEGETHQACITIAEFLGELLARNGSVTLPGIGTFTVGIRAKKGKEKGLSSRTVAMSATGQPLGGAAGTAEGEGMTAEGEGSPSGDEHQINARSIEVGRINFRCSKELLKDVSHRLHPEGSFRQSRYFGYVPLYEPIIQKRTQRFAAARDYLRTHRFMRITDYMDFTGLSYTTAQRELKLASTLTHSGIAATGRGSHRIYVLSASAASQSS
ncbi:MAG: hypothetical protein IJ767_08920 [Bacteroidaceae bacterium]|nr:hypothetical protein [Bacteroidaceae bacterium]